MPTYPFKIVSDEDFQAQVADSPKPVIVAFGTWRYVLDSEDPTNHNHMSDAIRLLTEVVKAHPKMTVAAIDADANGKTVSRYRISGIPRFMLFKGKKNKKKDPIATEIGEMSGDEIAQFIAKHLPGY